MGVVLGLFAALAYGVSDFSAGVASRRIPYGPATVIVQLSATALSALVLVVYRGSGPSSSVLLWGAVAGAGGALGTLSLYRGFAVGPMTVVATSSAVLAAVLPAVVGIAQGNRLPALTAAGIAIAVPAIALVSWHTSPSGWERGDSPSGWERDNSPRVEQRKGFRAAAIFGVLAGIGFGVISVGLDHAGGHHGAWPVIISQAIASVLVLPWLRQAKGRSLRPGLAPAVGAGVLATASNVSFVVASDRGELAVIGVMVAMYPAATILLARIILGERWSRTQIAGLAVAAGAIGLISAG